MHKKLLNRKHQNRWEEVIRDSEKNILFETKNFSDDFVKKILDANSLEVSKAYERGLKEGVEIAKDVYSKG